MKLTVEILQNVLNDANRQAAGAELEYHRAKDTRNRSMATYNQAVGAGNMLRQIIDYLKAPEPTPDGGGTMTQEQFEQAVGGRVEKVIDLEAERAKRSATQGSPTPETEEPAAGRRKPKEESK